MKAMILALLFVAAATIPAPAIDVTTAGLIYKQDFDALAASGTGNSWVNNSTIMGWYLFDRFAGAITSYDAGNGSVGTGKFYSFGGASAADRALGGIGSGGAYFGSPSSGSIAGWIAASFVNNTGGTLSGFTANWDGEQWRNGGNTASQTMAFEYGFGATFAEVASWTAPGGSFNWISPVIGDPAAAVDGNDAGHATGVGGTIGSIDWANDQTLWLRWVERNDTGNDHGLAIDDFSFTAHGASAVPDTGSTAFLLSLPLLGLLAMRRMLPQPICIPLIAGAPSARKST